MIENNYFLENQDLQENFQFIIDWKEIINGFEDDFTDHKIFQKNGDESLSMAPGSYDEALEYYKSILESGGEIAGRQISSIAKDMDVEGLKYSSGKVTFSEAMIEGMEQVKNSGILPYSIGRKHGGLGVPATIQCMMLELFSRANGFFAISL